MAISTDGTINRDPILSNSGSISGALTHTGTSLGFFGATPVSQPAQYTQTYATATRTHLGMTAASAASPTLTLVSPLGFSSSAQFQAMSDAINNLVIDMGNVKQVLNAVIDDLQSLGLLK